MNKIYDHVEGHATLMLDVINAILEVPNGMVICDLMACEGSITGQLHTGKKVFVDVVRWPVKKFNPEHDVQVTMDSIEYLKSTYFRFSACICLDGLEHLEKNRGLAMIELMKQKSDIQIIFTPLGDFAVETVPTDNPDAHKSGWLPEEFEKIGWATITFPQFHKAHNAGAFFSWNKKDLANESNRVISLLDQKLSTWIK